MMELIANKTRYKNTKSKVFKILLSFLRTEKHKHMLYWEEEEKEFTVVYVHKKNKKWKPKDISLFKALDEIFHHSQSGKDYEERSKGRFKSNMTKLCSGSRPYLKELRPSKKVDNSTWKKSYRILNRHDTGENGFFTSVNRESSKVESNALLRINDNSSPSHLEPEASTPTYVLLRINDNSLRFLFPLEPETSTASDVLPPISDVSSSSMFLLELEASTPHHVMPGNEVSSNSVEGLAHDFQQILPTPEKKDCNNSMPLEMNIDLNDMSMSTLPESNDIISYILSEDTDFENEANLYSNTNEKDDGIISSKDPLLTSTVFSSVEPNHADALPLNVETSVFLDQWLARTSIDDLQVLDADNLEKYKNK